MRIIEHSNAQTLVFDGGGLIATPNEIVAEGEILFAHANPTQLPPGLPDTKFVFNGELTHLLHMAAAVSKKPSPTV